jgi:hypothetical protein
VGLTHYRPGGAGLNLLEPVGDVHGEIGARIPPLHPRVCHVVVLLRLRLAI